MAVDWVGNYHWRERTTDGVIISAKEALKTHIFLDTNFLMALGQMPGFNLTSELDRVVPAARELIVLQPIKYELDKLHQSLSLKIQKEAQIALTFVEKYCQLWEVDYQHKNVDFILLEYGEKFNGLIATNDRKLKKLARNKLIKTLYIRSQRYLQIQ